jgi:hypothetical protein
MSWKSLDDLKIQLKKSGSKKAILSDDDMARAISLLDKDGRAMETPPDELRYMEGLFNLPIEFIKSFKIIPKPGFEKCTCGRVPSALDIVYFAFSKQIHSRDLIRDTLLGISNILEISEEGRTGECLRCGRPLLAAVYWKKGYGYAAF